MKVFVFFALFCLAVASASVIGLGGVPVSHLGVPVVAPGVVVGGLGVPGLIAPGILGHVGHVGVGHVIG